MKELKDKAQALIDHYTPALTQKGLKLSLSKSFFETKVSEGSIGTGGANIFNYIDRARNHKKEKENGYHYQNNSYHCLILTLLPDKGNTPRRHECREYAFVVQKKVRPHIGQKPHCTTYDENKILSKIEKRILKILKKADYTSVSKMCQNNFLDAFRYSMLAKYEYKKKFLGKERDFWDMIFLAAFCILLLEVCLRLGSSADEVELNSGYTRVNCRSNHIIITSKAKAL